MAIGCRVPSAFSYVSISCSFIFKCWHLIGFLCFLCISYLKKKFKMHSTYWPHYCFVIGIIWFVFKACPGVKCEQFILIDHLHSNFELHGVWSWSCLDGREIWISSWNPMQDTEYVRYQGWGYWHCHWPISVFDTNPTISTSDAASCLGVAESMCIIVLFVCKLAL